MADRQLMALLAQRTDIDFNSGLPQAIDAASCNPGIGIFQTADNTFDASSDDRIGARWRAPVM